METTPAREREAIVVAFDSSPSSEQALASAIELVTRAPHHVLHVATVLDPTNRSRPSSEATYENADRLQATVAEHIAAGFAGRESAPELQCFVHVRIGKPATEILAVASDVSASLVFIGSHGRTGIERFLLGSISERVVREARCPVMVVRAKTYPPSHPLHVVEYDHPRAPHREPRRYEYTNRQLVFRPTNWPLY